MSSHHIIRENQEPAVAILDSKGYSEKVLNEALEWSPFVITTSHCVNHLLTKGIKLDAVIGSSDSLRRLSEVLSNQSHITYQECHEEDLLSDTLKFLEGRNHTGVHVFSKFNVALTAVAKAAQLTINVVDNETKWSFIKSGYVRKWFPKGSSVQVSAEGDVLVKFQDSKLNTVELQSLEMSGVLSFRSAKPFWLGEYVS